MDKQTYDRMGTSVFREPSVNDAARRLMSCRLEVLDIERVVGAPVRSWAAKTSDGPRIVEWDGAWHVRKVAQ